MNVPISGLLTEGSFLLLSSGRKKVIVLRTGIGYLKKLKGSQGDRALRRTEKNFSGGLAKGHLRSKCLIGCEPNSPPLTQQHLQKSHINHGCACVREFLGVGESRKVLKSKLRAGKG